MQRMMSCFATVMLTVSAGCGGSSPQDDLPADYNVDGVYTGSLQIQVTCSDGSGASGGGSATWEVGHSGDVIQIPLGCGMLQADRSGPVAMVRPMACTNSGSDFIMKLTGETLDVARDRLDVSLTLEGTSMSSSARCTSRTTGTIYRSSSRSSAITTSPDAPGVDSTSTTSTSRLPQVEIPHILPPMPACQSIQCVAARSVFDALRVPVIPPHHEPGLP